MRAKQNIGLMLVVLLIPFMLANKSCERSTTWGEKYVAKWELDHADIDADTQCGDCHDDFVSTKDKPKTHDAAWIRTHGGYANMKFGMKNENVCYRCHAEATCTSCHQQDQPATHTEFWKRRGHGAFASLDRAKCTTCHTTSDFCERCHSKVAPSTHNAAWGGTTGNHCMSCHFPLNSAGAKECSVCHTATPAHDNTPNMPDNGLHVTGANCRDCHRPLRHPDNGMDCTTCHQ